MRPCLIDLIMGMPPPTEASNKRLTEFFSAKTESSSPYFAINALFAVTYMFTAFESSKN